MQNYKVILKFCKQYVLYSYKRLLPVLVELIQFILYNNFILLMREPNSIRLVRPLPKGVSRYIIKITSALAFVALALVLGIIPLISFVIGFVTLRWWVTLHYTSSLLPLTGYKSPSKKDIIIDEVRQINIQIIILKVYYNIISFIDANMNVRLYNCLQYYIYSLINDI